MYIVRRDLFDGIEHVGQSDQLFKIEEGLVLTISPHTGGQHLVGCLIFLVALCHDPAQIHLIQTPFRSTPESFGAVAVSGIGLICLLYTSPSPRDRQKSRMPSSA